MANKSVQLKVLIDVAEYKHMLRVQRDALKISRGFKKLKKKDWQTFDNIYRYFLDSHVVESIELDNNPDHWIRCEVNLS